MKQDARWKGCRRMISAAAVMLMLPSAPTGVAAQTPESSPRPNLRRIKAQQVGEIPKPTVVLKPGEEPKIKFETAVHDFGRAKAGTDVFFDYWFKNAGTGTLEILEVKPGCSCTTTSKHVRLVEPGQRAKIPIKMSTKKFDGPIQRKVTVYTNATGADSKLELVIKGNVWRSISMNPKNAGFGRIRRESLSGGGPVKKVTLINNLDRPVALSNVRSTTPTFRAELATVEDGKRFELSVWVTERAGTGSTRAQILIDTDLEDDPLIKVPALAYVLSDVDVTPPELLLQAGREKDMQMSFFVTSNAGQPVEVSDIKTSSPELRANLIVVNRGRAYRITVDVPRNFQLPPDGAMITMRTSHPKVPLLTVPIKLWTPPTGAGAKLSGAAVTNPRSGSNSTVGPGRRGLPAGKP